VCGRNSRGRSRRRNRKPLPCLRHSNACPDRTTRCSGTNRGYRPSSVSNSRGSHNQRRCGMRSRFRTCLVRRQSRSGGTDMEPPSCSPNRRGNRRIRTRSNNRGACPSNGRSCRRCKPCHSCNRPCRRRAGSPGRAAERRSPRAQLGTRSRSGDGSWVRACRHPCQPRCLRFRRLRRSHSREARRVALAPRTRQPPKVNPSTTQRVSREQA
jgi:hypothetical protein